MYLLAGITPPDIRRDVCARVEEETGIKHSPRSIWSEPNREPLEDICWNAYSLHIPVLWMSFSSSIKQRNSV